MFGIYKTFGSVVETEVRTSDTNVGKIRILY